MIETKKLVKRFGLKTILRGVDFSVEPGEFVALLGPNGAGKTTFLRILATLSRPSLGSVKVAGYSLPNESAQVRARLGVVSHMPLLYPDLTAEENLEFYARMYGISNFGPRITEVLGMVGLENRRKDLVRTFSRGMQQRLAIGRAVIHDPEVMLFDEPYTGLDQDASEMLDEVLRSVAAKGRTGSGGWSPAPPSSFPAGDDNRRGRTGADQSRPHQPPNQRRAQRPGTRPRDVRRRRAARRRQRRQATYGLDC